MEWKIERLRDSCQGCQAAFTDQERVFSVVGLDERDVPTRRDYCRRCFADAPAGDIHWETRWERPGEHRRRIDFNRLLRLFEAWLARPPQGQKELVYLIALLLLRKRFFRLLDLVNEAGEEFLRLRRPGPEQKAFLVPAPLLTKAQIPVLRERLEALLDGAIEEGDLEAGTAAREAAPGAVPPAP